MIDHRDKLNIFEDFITLRFEEEEKDSDMKSSGFVNNPRRAMRNHIEAFEGNAIHPSFEARISGGEVYLFVSGSKISQRIWAWIVRIFGRPPKKLSVSEFFEDVKTKSQDLDRLGDRIADYEMLLKQAKENGQEALFDKLTTEIQLIKAESQLYSLGHTRIITEEQIVDFFKKSVRGLQLDWLSNFTRIIPTQATEAMKELNKLRVFHNYVVLHYDPEKKNSEKTNKEKEAEKIKKKDPILFGVRNDSRKLYFIADWIDEVCDLTFKDLVKAFGLKAITANDISVRVYKKPEDYDKKGE